MKIKTRFAPSPTGNLHIGSVRTALYSWIYSKKNNGKFVLRIEDSDYRRYNENSVKNILSSMRWLGLKWDDGPYFQTKRINLYLSILNQMISKKIAYRCYCSKDRLNNLRKFQIKNKEKPRYDGHCRNLSFNNINDNKKYVVRFKNPVSGYVIFYDLVRGKIKFNNSELDDLILCRSDGIPTYNFCSVIDDMNMKITHIIRGDEHINNTPRQINILKSLGAEIPKYAHISMILDENKKKMSKRLGSIDILQYKNEGFLPESLLNYLVRLGWSHGNKEIFTIDEMVNLFSFDKINKSSAIYDFNKLLWLNKYYIKNLPSKYVLKHLKWHIKQIGFEVKNEQSLLILFENFKKNFKTLKEMAKFFYYFYRNFNLKNDKYAIQKICIDDSFCIKLILKKFYSISEWDSTNIKNNINHISKELCVNFKKIATIIRIAVIGIDESPSISKILFILGKNKVLKRLEMAYLLFKQNKK